MALAGAARTATEAWCRQAPDLPQELRDELEAGLVANGVYRALLDGISPPSSADFDRDARAICTAAGIDMRQSLQAFHREQYSSHLMTLVVLGQEPLDVLQSYVVASFHDMPRRRGLERHTGRWSSRKLKPYRTIAALGSPRDGDLGDVNGVRPRTRRCGELDEA